MDKNFILKGQKSSTKPVNKLIDSKNCLKDMLKVTYDGEHVKS